MLDPEDLEKRQRRSFRPMALVNPRIKPVGHAGARFFEGCLSVPGYQVSSRLRVRQSPAITRVTQPTEVSPGVAPQSCRPACECASFGSCCEYPTAQDLAAMQAMVERYLEVDVVAVTPMGDPVRFRAHGWQARILQHEMDHLKVRHTL
jgi:peptide deformylase